MLAGRFARAGCPTDVSHDTVRVIGAEVIAAAGSDGPRAGPGMLWRQRLDQRLTLPRPTS